MKPDTERAKARVPGTHQDLMPARAVDPDMVGRDVGATLVELLLALAIMVGVVALAAPALQRTRAQLQLERQIDGAAHYLEAERLRAMQINETVVVSARLRQLLPTLDGDPPQFTFRPDGSGEGGRVQVGSGRQSRIIDLDPVTSRPRINVAR